MALSTEVYHLNTVVYNTMVPAMAIDEESKLVS